MGKGLRPRPQVSVLWGLPRPPVKAIVCQNVSGALRIDPGLRPPGLGEDTLLLCGTLLQPPWELTHTPGCWLGLTRWGRAGDKRPEFGARQPLPLRRPPPNPRPPTAKGLNGGCKAELATLSCKAPGVSPVPAAHCAPQQESGRTTCRWMDLPACQHNFIYKTRRHPGLWFATPGLEAPSVQVTC